MDRAVTRGDEADRDGFAVLQRASRLRLDGMRKRVPQVQQRPGTGLPFVGLHDGRLDRDASLDEAHERAIVEMQDFVGAGLEFRQQVGVGDQGVLDALGEAAAEVTRFERHEQMGIGEHHAWLPEHADQVLADPAAGQLDVDPGLAADRGVDHRQQRRRHLHERDAAHERRRGEAGRVADDAAAERDHRAGSIQARIGREHRVVDASRGVERLVPLDRRRAARRSPRTLPPRAPDRP